MTWFAISCVIAPESAAICSSIAISAQILWPSSVSTGSSIGAAFTGVAKSNSVNRDKVFIVFFMYGLKIVLINAYSYNGYVYILELCDNI